MWTGGLSSERVSISQFINYVINSTSKEIFSRRSQELVDECLKIRVFIRINCSFKNKKLKNDKGKRKTYNVSKNTTCQMHTNYAERKRKITSTLNIDGTVTRRVAHNRTIGATMKCAENNKNSHEFSPTKRSSEIRTSFF